MPRAVADDGPLWALTATEAAAAVREGTVAPLELVDAALRRAHEVDPALGAFTGLEDERARDEARCLGDELRERGPRGPLHGVPVAIKDVIDVAGRPTLAGSRVPDDRPAARSAVVVARLRAAGAVVIGKTATHEVAIGVTTRATANPWDTDRIAGGSSGGSAVAVAAGAVPLALGTDTAGSIRIPAAFCGIGGLKPRRGALPSDGILALAPTMDSCGPLARTAQDLALAWQALTGAPAPAPAAPARLALAGHDDENVDGEIARAVEDAAEVLCFAGARRATPSIVPFAQWDRPRGLTVLVEALEEHRRLGWYPARADAYGDEARTYLDRAAAAAPAAVLAAQAELGELVAQLLRDLEHVDVLVLPVTPVPPAARAVSGDVARADARQAKLLARYCGPINAAGLAAVGVPCGFMRDGLPIGVQLVARDEATALAAALEYQRLTDVHHRRPPEPFMPRTPGAASPDPRESP